MKRLGVARILAGAAGVSFAFASLAADHPFFHELVAADGDSPRTLDGIVMRCVATACAAQTAQAAGNARGFGCTSCVRGRFFGRNYDWTLDTVDEWLVRVPARTDRHGSVGIASPGVLAVTERFGFSASSAERRACTPYLLMDGVNDAGVAASCHFVELGDVGPTTGTRPGAPRVPCSRFVRAVLDECASAASATGLAARVDLVAVPGCELQWLVADRTGASFAIGIVSNRVAVVPQARTLVNYALASVRRTGTYPPLSSGMEREERLLAGLGAVRTVADMAGLLAGAWYSRYVREGAERDWWSEMNGTANAFRARWPESPEVFYHGDTNDFRQAAQARLATFAAERAELAAGWQRIRSGTLPTGNETWATLHSCVYDLEARALDVRILERDASRHYELDR